MNFKEYYENYSFDKIRNVVSQATLAPFWQSKIGSLNIVNLNDFHRIPITTRREVNELVGQDKWKKLSTTSHEDNHIEVTSGGRPFRLPFISYLSNREFEIMGQTIIDMFQKNKISSGSILITFPGVMPYPSNYGKKIYPEDLTEYRSSHVSGALFKHASIRLNLKTYCSGLRLLAYKISGGEAAIEKDRIMGAYNIAKPKILAVSPNVLRNIFFPELERSGRKFGDYNTRILISGGSKLTTDDYKRIQYLGNPKIIVWIESGEIGTIGYSDAFCASHSKRLFYYTSWSQNFFETIDCEGNQLPYGSRGRIIVTRLTTYVQPLIRYDLEDEGSFFIRDNDLLLENDIVKL